MYILRMLTGYVESQSLAALTAIYDSNEPLTTAQLLEKFIGDFRASLVKRPSSKCCKKYTSRDEKYCAKCGRPIAKEPDSETYREAFLSTFGSTINDSHDFIDWDELERRGWSIGNSYPQGKHLFMSVENIDGFVAHEYDMSYNYFFDKEFRNIEITH